MANRYMLPKLIAHRGACGYAPENTLAAFRRAHELGATWVEFDVVLSKDGVPVIFHDSTTTRTTNLPDRKIADLTLKEIKQLDAGSWFSSEFRGEQIPTLEETLTFLRKHRMQANIEIKPTSGLETQTTKKALAIIEQFWPEKTAGDLPLISSFASECLVAVRYMHSTMPLALVRHKWDNEDAILLTFLQCKSINLDAEYLNEKQIKMIKALGYDIMAYTVNEVTTAQQLFNWGVSGVFTNYFDRLNKGISHV